MRLLAIETTPQGGAVMARTGDEVKCATLPKRLVPAAGRDRNSTYREEVAGSPPLGQ